VTTTEATEVAADEPDAGGDIGWGRAIASGMAILLVGFLGSLGGANLVLTKALGLTRDARQWIATALFIAVVIVVAWALRWLQHRGLI
jgi:hypothetical protein